MYTVADDLPYGSCTSEEPANSEYDHISFSQSGNVAGVLCSSSVSSQQKGADVSDDNAYDSLQWTPGVKKGANTTVPALSSQLGQSEYMCALDLNDAGEYATAVSFPSEYVLVFVFCSFTNLPVS